MAEIVVVGAFTAEPGTEADAKSRHFEHVLQRADELFESSDITVYNPVPGGESTKGSLAEHAGSAA